MCRQTKFPVSKLCKSVSPKSNLSPFISTSKRIWNATAGLGVLMLLVSGAYAQDKNKTASPKRDPLADYIKRVTSVAPVSAHTTLGSLWIDNGRLANMVADYASAQVDQRKVGKLALAIQVAFQEMGVFQASTTEIPLSVDDPMPFSTVQAIENVERTSQLGDVASAPTDTLAGSSEETDISTLQNELEESLQKEIALHQVSLHRESDGLVVSLREFGFFDAGSATIKSQSLPALDRIASVLALRTYKLRIEGHTDNIPIHTAQVASNWELSTNRATELVRLLILRHGFAPERLSAAGYAQYHPIASNLIAQGRAQNRRVDIVILTSQVLPSAASTGNAKPSPSR
jgi:chemotaxis protein MotB